MVNNATATENNTLLTKLIDIQRSQDLSDTAFSKTVDIPRAYWTQIRNGVRPIGITLIRGILRTYPELESDIITYLRDGGKG